MISVPPAALQVINPPAADSTGDLQLPATAPTPEPAPASAPAKVPQAAIDEFNAFLHYFEARHRVRVGARMILDSRQGIRGEIVIDAAP